MFIFIRSIEEEMQERSFIFITIIIIYVYK